MSNVSLVNGHIDKVTNYDRIKSMSIDELAAYLIDCCNCPNDMFLYGSKGSVSEKHIKQWLESEVETNERYRGY